MKKILEVLSGIFKNIWFGVRTSFIASKKYFILKLFILLSTTIAPLYTMWIWKEILNNIVDVNNTNKKIILLLATYLFIKLIIYVFEKFDTYVNKRYSDELQFYIEGVMIEKTSRMDLAFFDSATMGDKVKHARSNFDIMTTVTWLVFNIISRVINIGLTLIVVCSYRWWIGILTIILLIPFVIFNKKYIDRQLEMKKEQLRDNRKKDYYGNVFFNNDIQFEIKLNNIGQYFIEKYNEMWQKLYKVNKRENIRYNIINSLILILNISSEFLVIIVSVFDVLLGAIGIGDLQYNLSMVTRLRSQTTQLIEYINHFLSNNTRLNELQEFIAIKPEAEKSGKMLPSPNPKIEFCNVSFCYPNSEQYVLKNCSFKINPHEKIGLIGLNGSGKSTIIKLLFRFYDPVEGVIKIDGVDLKEYNIYAVRKIFGVLFQEYVTYCLPLREIIALSNFDERFNDEKIKRACDISGASELFKDWEQGYDTVMGRYYADNGKELSGGQWQLVGLARAYFKDCENIVLDEPSAALDPISEDRIFKQLYQLSSNKSSVTISHRLSNTMLADKILLIEDGHVVEEGSHFELLRKNGKYAHLFNLQASKYI